MSLSLCELIRVKKTRICTNIDLNYFGLKPIYGCTLSWETRYGRKNRIEKKISLVFSRLNFSKILFFEKIILLVFSRRKFSIFFVLHFTLILPCNFLAKCRRVFSIFVLYLPWFLESGLPLGLFFRGRDPTANKKKIVDGRF